MLIIDQSVLEKKMSKFEGKKHSNSLKYVRGTQLFYIFITITWRRY